LSDPSFVDSSEEMPNRTYTNTTLSGTNGYRFGFNGKELDKSGEWGSLTHYDYGFRIYNPSIGKFLSVDPLTRGYPELTPYQFASNSPNANSDIVGLEAKLEIYTIDKKGNEFLTVTNKFDLYERTYKNGQLINAQKISQQQFNTTLNIMWQTFTKEKTEGYIVQGFESYRRNTTMEISGKKPQFNDQSNGTLTISNTDDNFVVAVYNPKIVKPAKSVTFKESYNMAMKAKDVFFSNPDKLVEGSSAFKQSFDNAINGLTLPMSGQGVLGSGSLTSKLVSGAGTLNSLDDFTSNFTSNGNSIIQNSAGGNEIKKGINLISLFYGVYELKNAVKSPNLNSTEPVSEVISTIGDAKSVHDDVTKKNEKN
jgi:RHS repeat-associated protein